MLIRFSAENIKSLRDKQQISMVANNDSTLENNVFPESESDQFRMLKSAVIYGSNASGKTTVLDALSFIRETVLYSHTGLKNDQDIPLSPFEFDDYSKETPSRFEIDFVMNGIRSNFGFVLHKNKFLEEWLYCFPNRRKQLMYHRYGSDAESFKFGSHLKGENKITAKLTRPNSLFISAAEQNNHEKMTEFYNYFRQKISIVEMGSIVLLEDKVKQRILEDDTFKDKVVKLLKEADTGIVNIEAAETPYSGEMDILKDMFNEEMFEKHFKNRKSKKLTFYHQSSGPLSMAKLDMEKESQGTKRLLMLSGAIFDALEFGKVLLIDELEASMHPLMTRSIIKMFNSKNNTNGAQILFTTHDAGLLDNEIFRRDQVWFTEKGLDGATQLYPLSDYKPRKGENLSKGYLQGRYGAIPFQGELEF